MPETPEAALQALRQLDHARDIALVAFAMTALSGVLLAHWRWRAAVRKHSAERVFVTPYISASLLSLVLALAVSFSLHETLVATSASRTELCEAAMSAFTRDGLPVDNPLHARRFVEHCAPDTALIEMLTGPAPAGEPR